MSGVAWVVYLGAVNLLLAVGILAPMGGSLAAYRKQYDIAFLLMGLGWVALLLLLAVWGSAKLPGWCAPII